MSTIWEQNAYTFKYFLESAYPRLVNEFASRDINIDKNRIRIQYPDENLVGCLLYTYFTHNIRERAVFLNILRENNWFPTNCKTLKGYELINKCIDEINKPSRPVSWEFSRGVLRRFFQEFSDYIFTIFSSLGFKLDPIRVRLNHPNENTVGGQLYSHFSNMLFDRYTLFKLLEILPAEHSESNSWLEFRSILPVLQEEIKKCMPPTSPQQIDMKINAVLNKPKTNVNPKTTGYDKEIMSNIYSAEVRDLHQPELLSSPQVKVLEKIEKVLEKKVISNIPEKSDETGMCVVCFDTKYNTVFADCGHMSCCWGCSQNLETCPICRMKINKVIKIFMA